MNHCVNDILTTGAHPLFFLDYLATADLSQELRVDVVAGIGKACAEQNVALLGGETADMPDLYRSGDFDLAGFIIGVVDRHNVIDGSRLAASNVLVAFPSGGLQTNGYSLVREIWSLGKGRGASHDREVLDTSYGELDGTLGDALLAVHQSFLSPLEPYLGEINGIAHITGGGIPGNLSRLFTGPTEHLGAKINPESWETPAIFNLIRRTGSVEEAEMFRAFNMGVGIIVALDAERAQVLLEEQPQAWQIGEIFERSSDTEPVLGLPT